MYLAPDGDEAALADAAAAFLTETMPIARLHQPGHADMPPALRQRLGEMGWFALAVPEADGGSGLTAVEHALFFREAGRLCGPVDLLAQCLAANACEDAHLRGEIVAGAVGVGLLASDGDGWRLLGHTSASHALLVEPGGIALHSLASAQAQMQTALDPANSLRCLAALPEPIEARRTTWIWQLGQLGAAAMLVGIAEATLDLIVEYAKVRETFGRKIGAWQAVRHPCADMAVRVEAARAQLWYAAAAIKEQRGDAQAHLDAAKHCANRAALANADSSIQLHGGIGVTDEHDCHLLLKHALLLSRLFGGKRALLGQLLHAELED